MKIRKSVTMVTFTILVFIFLMNLNPVAVYGLDNSLEGSNSIDAEIEVLKFAHVNFPDTNTIELNVDLSETGVEVEDPNGNTINGMCEDISVMFASNTSTLIDFNYKNDGFDDQNGLLNEWVFYIIEDINGGTSWVWPESRDRKVSSVLSSGVYELEISAIFDLDSAYNHEDYNWWELEAGTYDDVIMELTIMASN